MNAQTLLLMAFAALAVAGFIVSATGWIHFGRERKAGASGPTPEPAADEAREAHSAET